MIRTANLALAKRTWRSYVPNSTLFSTMSTVAESEESEYQDNPMILQEKDLLRRSLTDSGTGLHVLDLIDTGSLEPDRVFYHLLLKRCTLLNKLNQGQLVHAHLLNSHFKHDLVLQNTILNMYAKCGKLNAGKVFDQMPTKNVIT